MATLINSPIVYGINLSPEEIRERNLWHETTYLEYEIPKALEKELSKIIDKKIKEFKKQCACDRCKLQAD